MLPGSEKWKKTLYTALYGLRRNNAGGKEMRRNYWLLICLLLAGFLVPAHVLAAPARPGGKISVNSASAMQLAKVPGVTSALAKAIVDYRTKNGPFKKPDDLLKVPGMTKEILKKMAPQTDFKGDILLPAGGKPGEEDEEEPSLKPSKC
jgi:competence protein ComEA